MHSVEKTGSDRDDLNIPMIGPVELTAVGSKIESKYRVIEGRVSQPSARHLIDPSGVDQPCRSNTCGQSIAGRRTEEGQGDRVCSNHLDNLPTKP